MASRQVEKAYVEWLQHTYVIINIHFYLNLYYIVETEPLKMYDNEIYFLNVTKYFSMRIHSKFEENKRY